MRGVLLAIVIFLFTIVLAAGLFYGYSKLDNAGNKPEKTPVVTSEELDEETVAALENDPEYQEFREKLMGQLKDKISERESLVDKEKDASVRKSILDGLEIRIDSVVLIMQGKRTLISFTILKENDNEYLVHALEDNYMIMFGEETLEFSSSKKDENKLYLAPDTHEYQVMLIVNYEVKDGDLVTAVWVNSLSEGKDELIESNEYEYKASQPQG